jgi:hypothetical protein
MNKDQNNLMRNVNNKLRKNYRILCDLNPEDKGRTTRTKQVKGLILNSSEHFTKPKQATLIISCMIKASIDYWKMNI